MVAPALPRRLASASPLALAIAQEEEAPDTSGVYLLAFVYRGEHTPYPLMRASRHTGALHYCGWALNIRSRIEEHRAGRGARLCRAAIRAGYELRLVRVWPNRGRDYERALKDRHRLGAYCPDCWHGDSVPAPALDPGALASSSPTAPRLSGLWIAGDPPGGAQEGEARRRGNA